MKRDRFLLGFMFLSFAGFTVGMDSKNLKSLPVSPVVISHNLSLSEDVRSEVSYEDESVNVWLGNDGFRHEYEAAEYNAVTREMKAVPFQLLENKVETRLNGFRHEYEAVEYDSVTKKLIHVPFLLKKESRVEKCSGSKEEHFVRSNKEVVACGSILFCNKYRCLFHQSHYFYVPQYARCFAGELCSFHKTVVNQELIIANQTNSSL